MENNFYKYQRDRFGILLTWGIANIIAGLAIGVISKDKYWRNFGTMSAGWGIINALLARMGRSSATKNSQKYGDSQADRKREAGKLQRILLINVPLDASYVLGGRWLLGQKQTERKGMGLSIVIQGLWLFCYDSWLSREVGQRWKS